MNKEKLSNILSNRKKSSNFVSYLNTRNYNNVIQAKFSNVGFTHSNAKDKSKEVWNIFIKQYDDIEIDDTYEVEVGTESSVDQASTISLSKNKSKISISKRSLLEKSKEAILETLNHEMILHVFPEYNKTLENRDKQDPVLENVTEHLPFVDITIDPERMKNFVDRAKKVLNGEELHKYYMILLEDARGHANLIADQYLPKVGFDKVKERYERIELLYDYSNKDKKYSLSSIGEVRLQGTMWNLYNQMIKDESLEVKTKIWEKVAQDKHYLKFEAPKPK